MILRTTRLLAAILVPIGLAIAIDSACSSSPKACHTASDCNGGCCVLQDANTATGVCGDSDSSAQCLCVENQGCPGSGSCCQPFIDGSGRVTQAQVCATSHDSASLFECCQGGGPICTGSNCCAHMSTGGEYCAVPCNSDADCNGGSCVEGSPIDIFGCGNGNYCGPGTVTPLSSSASSSSSSGLPVGSACQTSPVCNSGCCGLTDADAGTGECLALDAGNPPDAGGACLCHGNADCPGTGACCQPFLDDAGVPTNAQACVGSSSQNPGAFQCCGFGADCQTNTCCVDMSTGGEYCATSCAQDSDCDGGHCVAGSPIAIFGCGGPSYCGP
jgi:hypothetical protein